MRSFRWLINDPALIKMQTDFIGMLISHQTLIPLPLWSSCPISFFIFFPSKNDAKVCLEWMVGCFSSQRWEKQRRQAGVGSRPNNGWMKQFEKMQLLSYWAHFSERFAGIHPALPESTKGWPCRQYLNGGYLTILVWFNKSYQINVKHANVQFRGQPPPHFPRCCVKLTL